MLFIWCILLIWIWIRSGLSGLVHYSRFKRRCTVLILLWGFNCENLIVPSNIGPRLFLPRSECIINNLLINFRLIFQRVDFLKFAQILIFIRISICLFFFYQFFPLFGSVLNLFARKYSLLKFLFHLRLVCQSVLQFHIYNAHSVPYKFLLNFFVQIRVRLERRSMVHFK